MPTLIVTADLECCRCSAKIQKVLRSIQDRGEFAVEKIVYEEERGRVLVSGPFDADKLCRKLWCKAGKVIKDIDVAKPKPKADDKKPEPCKQLVPYPYPFPYPYPYPQYPSAWPCGRATPYCECHAKPPPPPAPAPARAPACQCPTWPSCYCGSYPPYQLPMPMQPYCPPVVVCEESPPYGACAIM